MDIKKQQMEVMHSMCQYELNILQKNLQSFLQENDYAQKLVKEVILKDSGVVGLMCFDRYMSQVVAVFNMARKLNIHFQINSLQQSIICGSPKNECFIEDGISQACSLNYYIERNNAIIESGFDSDITTSRDKFEVEESSQIQNVKVNSFDENGNERNSLVFSNDSVKHEENEELKNFHTERLIRALLPAKNLHHIKINSELEVYIVNVSNYKNLEFFICQLEDNMTLFDLSRFENFKQIPLSTLPFNDIFLVFEKKDDNIRDYMWRAVKVPYNEESNMPKVDSVYLVDFGENIVLTDKCITYEAPQCYREVPPLAVKCKLEGIENIFSKSIELSQEKCGQLLQKNEFEKVTIRVVGKNKNVLRVVLLDFCKNFHEMLTIQNCKSNNPFLEDNIPENEQTKSMLDVLPSRPSTQIPSVNVGDNIQIIVTHVENPISFYAIIQSDLTEDCSEVFFWNEHQICSSQKTIISPQVNDIVLAQYNKDNYYYRAKVIDADQELDRYKVFYVDFGNTEVVSLYRIAKCAKEQLEEPFRAVLFHMSNLSLVTLYNEAKSSEISYINSRLKNAQEYVVVMILDQILNVKIIAKHNDELFVKLLDGEYDSIPNMLLNIGVVKEL